MDLRYTVAVRMHYVYFIGLLLASCTPLAEPVPMPTADQVMKRPVNTAVSSSSEPDYQSALSQLDSTIRTSSGQISFLDSGILEYGNPEAPLILTVFTEYHCKYCYQFQADQLRSLKTDYIDSGQLKVRFLTLPLNKYPNSLPAKQAMLCAADQGKGFAMHELLTGSPDRSAAAIAARLDELNIDPDIFAACLESADLQRWLDLHARVSSELDVTLVPTFFIGNQKKTGLPFYKDLSGWIDSLITQS